MPPWSLRPPTILPELWTSISKKEQAALRATWRTEHPAEFEAQERRRSTYQELKKSGRVVQAMPAVSFDAVGLSMGRKAPALMVVSTAPCPASAASTMCQVDVKPFPEVTRKGAQELHNQLVVRIEAGEMDLLVLELCCDESSQLGLRTPAGCGLYRVTSTQNIVSNDTRAMINNIIDTAKENKVHVHGHVSIPCTAGCRWAQVNRSLGFPTGDIETTKTMIKRARTIVQRIADGSGTFSWEWPDKNELWQEGEIQDLIQEHPRGVFRLVAFAAVDGQLQVREEKVVVQKTFRFFTTSDGMADQLAGLDRPPASDLPVVRARGDLAQDTANYTPVALVQGIGGNRVVETV